MFFQTSTLPFFASMLPSFCNATVALNMTPPDFSEPPCAHGMDGHVQVHRWQLRQASEAASSRDKGKAEVEDVHALLLGPQDDPEPEAASQSIMTELGMGTPLLLQGEPPRGSSAVLAQGAQLRRSDSSRSTASRMSSKSPPPRRQAPRRMLAAVIPPLRRSVGEAIRRSAGMCLAYGRQHHLYQAAWMCVVRMQTVSGGLGDE